MKKAHKEALEIILDDYLKENNFTFGYENHGYSGLRFIKNTKNEEPKKYHKEEFLFKTNLGDLAGRDYIYQFMERLFNSPIAEEKEIGFRFMVEKFPVSNVISYDEMYKKYIEILSSDKDKLFDFVSKKGVLTHNLSKIEKVMLDNKFTQEQCKTIIENCLQMKVFNSFYNENQLYNIACNVLDNPNEYKEFFMQLKQEDQEHNFITEEKEKKFFSVSLSLKEIKNVEEKLTSDHIERSIKSLAAIDKIPSILQVDEIIVSIQNKKINILTNETSYQILYVGEELNKKLLKDFTNKFLEAKLFNKLSGVINYNNDIAEQVCSNIIAKNLESKISKVQNNSIIKRKKV